MKRYRLLAAALCLPLLLCACQGGHSSQTATPDEAVVTTAAPTDPEPGNYVSPAREETFTYIDAAKTEHEVTYQIPQLNFRAEEAQRINKEIAERYEEDFAAAEEQQNKGGAPAYVGISYQANVNDDILTLLIQSEWQNHAITYSVYNFNYRTKKQLDNDGLLAYLQRDREQTFTQLREALENDYYAKYQYENFPDDYYYQLDLTTGDEGLYASRLFLNHEGELYAVCTEYASVGIGAFEVMIKL